VAATKRLITPSVIDCDTTAVRLAYTFVASDVGSLVNDFENGHSYLCVSAGSGAACMRNLTGSDLQNFPIMLNDLREVSSGSDVSNIAANGGLLASDTTPILRGDAAESWEVSWAASNSDEIGFQISLPLDITGAALMDGTRNAYLVAEVYGAGTTNDATFTVNTSWDGGAQVVDTLDDSASKAITRHRVVCTIAAADIPDSPKTVSIEMVLAAHTTDVLNLTSLTFMMYRK
jgi:hypothetical protein